MTKEPVTSQLLTYNMAFERASADLDTNVLLRRNSNRTYSNRPQSSAEVRSRARTPYRTVHSRQSSIMATSPEKHRPRGKYPIQQRLNSLLVCQQTFDRAVSQAQQQFDRQKEFFRFYKKHSQLSASYLDSAWRAKAKKQLDLASPIARTEPHSQSHSHSKIARKAAETLSPVNNELLGGEEGRLCCYQADNKGTFDFQEFLTRTLADTAGDCENIEHSYNVERVIAIALMKQYIRDVDSIPSEVMQCQMLFEKVHSRDSGKKSPSLLLALLAGTVLEKMTRPLSNYSAIFIPLKDLLMRLIFSEYYSPTSPKQAEECKQDQEKCFGAVPYYVLTNYFARKMKQCEMEKEECDQKVRELKRQKAVILSFADRFAQVKKVEFKRRLMHAWLMTTKRKSKAYWLRLWQSSYTDKEILRKAFYQLYQYTKRKRNSRLKKLYDSLNEDYEKVQQTCNDLKKNVEERVVPKVEPSPGSDYLSSAGNFSKIAHSSVKTLLCPFMSSFFKRTVVRQAIGRAKIRIKFRQQDLTRMLQNPLQSNPKAQISIISEMSMGEFLLNWVAQKVKLGVEGMREYVRSYGFVQQLNLSEKIRADYSKDTKTYVDRLTGSLQSLKDLCLINYADCEVLLVLVTALSPKALPYSRLIEQYYYAQPEERLRLLVHSLDLLCKRRMDDFIIPHDVLTNNASHIVQLLAYLYVTKHGIEPLGKLREAEEPCQKPVIDQVYKSLFPFVKSSVSLNSLPDVAILFPETKTGEELESAIENSPGERLAVKIVNLALEARWQISLETRSKGEEEEKKAKKVERQIEALHFTQISSVRELFDGNYRNLLLFLTFIAPEYLLDYQKAKEISQGSGKSALNYVRAQLLCDSQHKINGNIVRMLNKIAGSRVLMTLQDLQDKAYNKITLALIEAVVKRPWFLINKCSRVYPQVAILKKLYSLHREGMLFCSSPSAVKTVFLRGDPFNTGKALQGLLCFYENNSILVDQAVEELELARYRFCKLKRKLRGYGSSLFAESNRGGVMLEISKKLPVLAGLQNFEDRYVTDYFGITEPAAILQLRQNLSKVLLRHSYHLISRFNKQLPEVDAQQGFKLSYFDLWNVLKFMNVSTFKFDSTRLEPFLNNYVKEKLHSPFFAQYFYPQGPRALVKKPSFVKRQSAATAIPTGEAVYEAYLKYYQHEFGPQDFIQIMISIVFRVFNKEIQGESHSLKTLSISKEDTSPAKVSTYISNICLFMDRFLQISGLTCSKLGGKHPFRLDFYSGIWESLQPELRPLVVIFHALIQKRLKRVAVDQTNTGHLLLLSPDDCYILLTDIGAFAHPGFVIEEYRRVMAMVVHQENYCHHVAEKYEANSKAVLSFYEFAEFLYLVAEYMNPCPFAPMELKFAFLLHHVIYPHMRDKVPELKTAFQPEVQQTVAKRKKSSMLALDKFLFSA